jgi:phosphoribosylamine---glycine ligase
VRICVASEFGEGLWLAWKMSQEGHNVSAVVSEPRYTEALKGLVIVMPGSEVYKASTYDLVVFDATGMGKQADEARKEVPTIGDSLLADKLEEDRVFALDLMAKCGLQVAPWEKFTDPSDAIRFIKKRNTRLVFKPVGEQDDKSTTYVARSAEDMLRYFDVLFRTAKVSEFILQEYVAGTEVSLEVYINETGYYALNATLETKKLMNGDLGPNTGCSGSLCWMMEKENPLFEKGLKKCIAPLQEMGYVGPLDLNCIVNESGLWSLEFTPRFGYDASALLTRLLPVSFADFLYAVASNQTVPYLSPKHSFCSSVRLSIPPYPCEGLPDKFYKAGVPIQGLLEKNLDRFFIYDVRKRAEDSDDLESAGLCGWIGSPLAVGETIGAAFDGCENMLKEVRVPNGMYRTDVRDNVAKRYLALREGGWLKTSYGTDARSHHA